jgi:bacteriorhodopsin
MFWVLTLAQLNGSVRRASHARSAARHRAFGQLFSLVSVGWSIYPFAWVATADGFALVSFRVEAYMLAGLDVETPSPHPSLPPTLRYPAPHPALP